MISPKRLVKVVVAAILIFMVTGNVSRSLAQDNGDTSFIHGCVISGSGKLRIIDTNDACKDGETEIFLVSATGGGNVGIGTTDPSEALDVVGNIRASGNFIAGNTTTYEDGAINLSPDTNLDIDSGTLFIDNANNRVGIGNTGPISTLDVRGGRVVIGSRFVFDGEPGFWIDRILTGFNEPTGPSDAFLFVSGYTGVEDSDLRLYVLDNSEDQFSIWGDSCTGGDCADINASTMAHSFRADGNASHMGNVGIGTANPLQTLHVSGDTLIEGTLSMSDSFGNPKNVFNIGGAHGIDDFTKIYSAGEGITFLNQTGTSESLIILESGNVGVGNHFPEERFSVEGRIESKIGGFVFPDGSVQTSAAPLYNSFAVCTTHSEDFNVCSCGDANTISRTIASDGTCQVTSDTGSCTGTGSSDPFGDTFMGSCCLCREQP